MFYYLLTKLVIYTSVAFKKMFDTKCLTLLTLLASQISFDTDRQFQAYTTKGRMYKCRLGLNEFCCYAPANQKSHTIATKLV